MSKSNGVAEIVMKAKGHISRISCLVIEGLGAELLLGWPWLCEWNPTVDWATGVLQFSDGIYWKPKVTDKYLEASLAEVRMPTLRMGEKGKRRVWEDMKKLDCIESGGGASAICQEQSWQGVKYFTEVFEEPQGVPKQAEVEHEL